ncbi:hypothetical protein T03_3122 [Trichinella britovi]|uniref:MULE transposase domain-containing protein n=1 Tax=Trichinella britovi TaxID=45882 RepID=A0A0V1CB17_TRIBR|nr:hypothetical protein T03_3122 [Trichinella britovi]
MKFKANQMLSGMPLKYTQGEDPCMMLCPVPFRTTKAGEDFLFWQNSSRHILVFATGSNIRLLADRRALGMDGTFTVLPQWYQQLFTIHEICGVYAGAGSLPFMATSRIRGYRADTSTSARWYIKKSVSCGLKTRYRTEIETKRKIRMLLATAFLPVPQVDTGVRLLEAGTTGNLLALFQYFWQEWMTDERLPLWNVHNVNIQTNNHLEGWHNQLNKKAGGNKLGLYRLLHYLEEEQGVMEMLINQLLSRNSAAGSIRQISSRCAEKQQRFIIYTDEYTSGRRTLEPHARADLMPPSKWWFWIERLPWHNVHKSGGHRSHPLKRACEKLPGKPPRILPLPAACRRRASEDTRPVMTRRGTQCTTVGPGNTHAYKQQRTPASSIFATEPGVRLLAQSNCWCWDGSGNFKILSSCKDLPMYSRIFEVLHSKAEELGAQLNPAKFVCDFETDFNFFQASLA